MASKYGRLYPERAVARVREVLRRLVNGETVMMADFDVALTELDEHGFPPDEPLFLLRGQDELAADTVADYFNRLCGAGLISADDDHAREHIDAMKRWQPRKMPD